MLLAVASVLAAGVALALLFASRPPGNNSAEAGFARDMIVHHGQAVQMAEIVRDRTQSDAVRLLAADISLTQQAQVGIMQGWLGVWGLPITGSEPAMTWMGHPTEGLMPGMATPEEIEYPLSPVEPDAKGDGTSTTVIHHLTLEGLLSGDPKLVNVHRPGSGEPPPVSCADLNEAL